MPWKILALLVAGLLCLNSGAPAQSTNYFTDLNIGPAGILTGGAGDRFIISGNLANASTQNVAWSTAAAELAFATGAAGEIFATKAS